MNSHSQNFTARQIADLLRRTRQGIYAALESVPSAETKRVAGQNVRAWRLTDLPPALCKELADVAQRRGCSLEQLLAKPPRPWQPPRPFAELSSQIQREAEQWRETLALPLARRRELPEREWKDLARQQCRRVFGREISDNTWLAHFDLAVNRDNCFEQWQRVDLYVAEAAYSMSPAPPRALLKLQGLHRELNEVIAKLENKSRPTLEDQEYVLNAACAHFVKLGRDYPGRREQREIEASLLHFLRSSVPGLALSGKTWKRRLKEFSLHGAVKSDQRPLNSGRTGFNLCDECAGKLVSNSVHRDGPIPPAHRKLMKLRGTSDGYCEACAEHVHLNERKSKSYVSRSIARQVQSKIRKLVDHRRSPSIVHQKSPWIDRDWSDVAPGDFFTSDDTTLNFPFRYEDGTGRIGRGDCILTADWRTDMILDSLLIAGHHNQEHVRLSVEHACQKVDGRPRLGFVFENSVYASLAVDGRDYERHPKWTRTPWREVEAAFRKVGLEIGPRNDMDFGLGEPALGLEVRHTKPKNARSKTIEGTIRRLQEIQRPIDNFLGFNERDYDAESAQRTLRQARQCDAAALKKIPTISEWRDILDQTIKEQNEEIQNGKKLPGLSPVEAWSHGIDGHPGIATRPLPGLDLETRFRIGTWQRKIRVGTDGIIINIGRRAYPYWGKDLEPYIHKDIVARYHFADPSIIFCRSLDSKHYFVLKHMTAKSTFEQPAVLAELNHERSAMMRPARIEYSKLRPPISFSVTRDGSTDQQTNEFARFSQEQLDKHVEEKKTEQRKLADVRRLAGTLGAPIRTTPRNVERVKEGCELEKEARREIEEMENQS